MNKLIDDIYFELLKEIIYTDNIVNKYNFNTNLLEKYPSIIIFLIYAIKRNEKYKIIDKNLIYDKLIMYIKNMITEINANKKINSSLCYGIISIGYAVTFCENILNGKKIIEDINYLISQITVYKLKKCQKNLKNGKIYESDYDVIQGISSNLIYLLKFNLNNNIKLVEEINLYFINILKNINKKYYFKGNNINWYLSHGIISIIYANALCSYKKINFKLNKLQFLKIVKYIKINKRKEYFDNITWCYGEISFNYLLYKCSKIYNLNYYEKYFYNKMIRRFNKKNIYKLDSPTFCHGYSGILSILNSIQKGFKGKDKLKKFLIKEILNCRVENYKLGFKNYDKILVQGKYTNKKYYIEDIGILSGSIGVILTLMDSIYKKELNWSEIFLI